MLSQCAFCNGDIEYGEEYAGTWADCPHCGKSTPLARPPHHEKPPSPVNWKKRLRTIILILAPLLVISIAFTFVALVAPRLQRYTVDWSILHQALVGIVVFAVLAAGTLLAIAWLLLPLLIWEGFQGLSREQRRTNDLLKK